MSTPAMYQGQAWGLRLQDGSLMMTTGTTPVPVLEGTRSGARRFQCKKGAEKPVRVLVTVVEIIEPPKGGP